MYCSPRCRQNRSAERARRAHRAERAAVTCQQCGALRKNPRGGGLCAHCARTQRTLKPCPRCGTPFWPWADGVKHARKYCSRACIKRPKAASTAAVISRAKPLRALSCRWCGTAFSHAHSTTAFCTDVCRKRARNQQKKARKKTMRSAPLIPLPLVYLRDQGVCALCVEGVDSTLRSPHPRAATLDHIIPLSKGGAHDEGNVQLAHYGCNSAKRDRLVTQRSGGSCGDPSPVRVGGAQALTASQRGL